MFDDPFENFGIDWSGDTDFDPPAEGERPVPERVAVVPPTSEDIRSRLHAICVLYRHASGIGQRLELIEVLEQLRVELAHVVALDLLDAGWRPDDGGFTALNAPPPFTSGAA